MEKEELELLKKKALEQFKTGKSLFGEGGAFAPMLKEFLEETLEAEMEEHLSKERDRGNKRNGKGSKTVKSSSRELTIQTLQIATAALFKRKLNLIENRITVPVV